MISVDQALAEAALAGIDLPLLERNLALTPDERLQQHESARALCHLLKEAGVNHARTQRIAPAAPRRKI
jgi:hypothetical protein